MSTKRRRTNGGSVAVVQRSAKRPIDKSLVYVAKTNLGGSQVTTDLLTATFPCTVTGLRWSLGAIADAGSAETSANWAIVVVRDGLSADTLSLTDGASFYNPEQNVLAFGTGALGPHDSGYSYQFVGETKTMRKLMGGDKLVFVALGQATNTVTIKGCVQFFCKS